MRRLLVVSLAMMLSSLSSMASAGELENRLERSRNATFTARQVTTCATPDGRRDALTAVGQSNGIMQVAAGNGTAVVVGRGARPVETEPTTDPIVTGSYETSPARSVRVVERWASQVTVRDLAGLERARMTFDFATGAVLGMVVLNGDGSTYCAIETIEFSDAAPPPVPVPEPPVTVDLDGSNLAPVVAGFTLRELFAFEGDSGVVGYYSDGLFSFTLLSSPAPVTLSAEPFTTVETPGGSYTRWFGAGQAAYAWENLEGGWILMGDLPLDLQEAVLAELPPPQSPKFFARVWRSLFGS